MEILFSFVAGALVNLGTCVCSCVNNTIKFQSNLDSLKTELKILENQRKSVKAQVEQAEKDGRHERTTEVTKWLDQVDTEVNSIQSKMEEANKKSNQFKLLCCLGTTEMADLLTQVKQLTKDGNFPSGCLVVENNQPIPVEHIPGPSIENQSTASKNLSKVLNLLSNDNVKKIGVLGMGGVGKTTLVKNLNNMLEKSSTTTTTRPYSIVIWVTISRAFDLKRVQTQIAERLKLPVSMNESVERMASQIYNSLKERSFLLILDDVWKRIDLECLGIPPPEQHNSCKVILTSRSLDVCRGMETDENVRVRILSDEEAWELFTSKVGEVATLTHIEPLAKQITRECQGLPLAIITVGASMREKKLPELWKDALNALQRSTPLNLITGIEDDVYKPLKWSYDSLPGMYIKCCFLYCCLYPEDFSIRVKELVHCWLAEGFIDELENYEASYNRGIALVEYLKDSCLLEEHDEDSVFKGIDAVKMHDVKMHDVVRDVAIQIACSLEAEHGFQFGSRFDHITFRKLPKSLKRVSFMCNRITSLPDFAIPFPHISTLLLQHNQFLENIAEGFLLGFPALKFLNLSHTCIQTLPRTLLKCYELQALFLRECGLLLEIPSLRGLVNLKMIDLSSTGIKELPEGMETLTNLRQLFLSYTFSLNKIRAGIISQLYSLEILDMTASAHKWAVRVGEREREGEGEGEGEGEASFEELGCLTQLSDLNIHLDVSCLSIDPPRALLELKKFQFFIGKYASSYPIHSKFDERRATLLHLNNFSNRWSSGPLKCATSMTLNYCEGFEQKPENFCFTNLRSLSICNTHLFEGENKEIHVASRYDLLPNLEELLLFKVEGINSISDLAGHFGLRLEKLRLIGVQTCHDLKYVFSVGGLGLALENLEEVRVSYCYNVVDLFRCESSSQTSALVDTSALNLKIVELKHLQRLETLSQPRVSWQRLERLEVIHCGLLKKLPLTAQIANTIKEIRGQSKWWYQLEWDDEDTKSNLQRYFKCDNYSSFKRRLPFGR